MENTKLKSYLYLHLLFILYSITTVVAKFAASYPFLSFSFLQYYSIEIIMIMVYAYFWQKIIKRFSLVTAYSNKGIVIFWGLVWANLIFNERVTINQIVGMIIIIFGIVLVVKNN